MQTYDPKTQRSIMVMRILRGLSIYDQVNPDDRTVWRTMGVILSENMPMYADVLHELADNVVHPLEAAFTNLGKPRRGVVAAAVHVIDALATLLDTEIGLQEQFERINRLMALADRALQPGEK